MPLTPSESDRSHVFECDVACSIPERGNVDDVDYYPQPYDHLISPGRPRGEWQLAHLAGGITLPSNPTTSIHPTIEAIVNPIPPHPVIKSIQPATCVYPNMYKAPQSRTAAVKTLMACI